MSVNSGITTVLVIVVTGIVISVRLVSRYTVESVTVAEVMVEFSVKVLLSVSVCVEIEEKRMADSCVNVIKLVSSTGTSVVVVSVVERVIVVMTAT